MMFANVQIDDHYCPDSADNAHQGIRKRHETGLDTHGLDEGVTLNTLRVPQTLRPWTFILVISQRQSLSQQIKNN